MIWLSYGLTALGGLVAGCLLYVMSLAWMNQVIHQAIVDYFKVKCEFRKKMNKDVEDLLEERR